jgi:hypothetical protein
MATDAAPDARALDTVTLLDPAGLQQPEPIQQSAERIPALEPATLPTHPLRAEDVTCFLPKVIG